MDKKSWIATQSNPNNKGKDSPLTAIVPPHISDEPYTDQDPAYGNKKKTLLEAFTTTEKQLMPDKPKEKTTPLNAIIDNRFKKGTPEREDFEYEKSLVVLGAKIKELRKEKNLSQAELGEKVQVTRSQIAKIENAYHNFTFATITKVFNALDANITFQIQPREPEE
ncbi:hypothetical protein AHMF7616_05352 [Adhaeribacter pallidiroseus]|uniref:HTH cro/C1-type domain-containing protein n=2 Tax=Adhaeribacter pallidiroseus TaxID=2072847 RepID=A0A369Q8V3_9BACT|nr:hypothetical protein AHMF7616_05308 [Adhaeribacter pallidiroseus]RDC58718.1 hypothetical protein AHMF7616_05352 [Adhaeribacter pallidiroseus]